jgi:hypothetical protein
VFLPNGSSESDFNDLRAWKKLIWKMWSSRLPPRAALEDLAYYSKCSAAWQIQCCNNLARMNRNLFTTDKGIIGNGPVGAQAGDELFVVKGVSEPLVMRHRKDKGCYSLIGFAIIEGQEFMDVNYWQSMEASEEIVIF